MARSSRVGLIFGLHYEVKPQMLLVMRRRKAQRVSGKCRGISPVKRVPRPWPRRCRRRRKEASLARLFGEARPNENIRRIQGVVVFTEGQLRPPQNGEATESTIHFERVFRPKQNEYSREEDKDKKRIEKDPMFALRGSVVTHFGDNGNAR